MKCLGELYSKALKLLLNSGVSTPVLDLELLMECAFNIRRPLILVNDDFLISHEQERIFWKMIQKRLAFCPISKIIGSKEFWSLNFIVDENVLDPRPDSETLISTIFKMYKNRNIKFKILDLGMGSGCLIIILILYYRYSIGYAFEKEVKSYRIARKNISKHGLQNRIKTYFSSWNQCKEENFDLIISNPPYIKRSDIKKLQQDVKLYDPTIALDGGISGLQSYFEIFQIIKRCLKGNGKAILEIGESQNDIHAIVSKYGLKFHYYSYDLSGKKRCIVIGK